MQQLITQFIEGNTGLLTHTTLAAYRQRLDAFAEYMGDAKVTQLRCQNWLGHMLSIGLSRRTAHTYYATAMNLYSWLLSVRLVEANPVPKLRRFVVPTVERKAMTQEDVTKLLQKADELNRRDWHYAILCAWQTGLRLGDVVTLKRCEVDLV